MWDFCGSVLRYEWGLTGLITLVNLTSEYRKSLHNMIHIDVFQISHGLYHPWMYSNHYAGQLLISCSGKQCAV